MAPGWNLACSLFCIACEVGVIFTFLSDWKKEQEYMTEGSLWHIKPHIFIVWPFPVNFCWACSRKRIGKALIFRNVILSFTFTLIPGGIIFETITGTLSLKNWEAFVLAEDWPVGLFTASDPSWLAAAPLCHGRREGAGPTLAPGAPGFLRFWVQQFMLKALQTSPHDRDQSPMQWISHLQLYNFVMLRFTVWEALPI